jgi:hypothetical protein
MVNKAIKFANFKFLFISAIMIIAPISITAETKKRHPLVPCNAIIQYAGSTGYISAGAEWKYGKHKQWGTALLIGYLPKFHSHREKAVATLKQTLSPWDIQLNKNINLHPLNCGMFLTTIYGNCFWTEEPDKYPDKYYQISTHLRIHIFAGQEIIFTLNDKYNKLFNSISLYYELNTCDLYLCSYFPNIKHLNISDIIKIGFGTKLNF